MKFLIADIEDRYRCLRVIGSGFISLILSVCEKAWLSSSTQMFLLVMQALCFFLSSRRLYSFSPCWWLSYITDSKYLPFIELLVILFLLDVKTRFFSIITVTNYLRKPNIIVIRGAINIWRIVSATALINPYMSS